jgi:hypothetical protein
VEVEVLRELLADRRAALPVAVRDVPKEGPRDAADIETAVRVEPPILDRDGRVAHRPRDVLERDRVAVDLAVQVGEQFAIGHVHLARP